MTVGKCQENGFLWQSWKLGTISARSVMKCSKSKDTGGTAASCIGTISFAFVVDVPDLAKNRKWMKMFKATLFASVCALGLSLSPAIAMEAKCDDASMASMNTEIGGMKDAKMQKMAIKEMKMADASMKKHQMKSCTAHMNKAMKAMGPM